MEEFKNQFKGETNWEELRDRFFKDLTKEDSIDGTMFRIDKDPSDVFEWFKNQFKQDSKEAGIEQVVVEKWKMDEIEDTLRMANNIHDSSKKETCFDRCVCKAWQYAKEALNSNNPADIDLKKNNMENKSTFTRSELVRFGIYLLSKERRELYAKTEVEGFSLEERLSQVNHADVENFICVLNEEELTPQKPPKPEGDYPVA